MNTFIYKKTLKKYDSSNEYFNKIYINNIINEEKKSFFFSKYQKMNEINNNINKTYIHKLYNLYQSIKILIKITEYKNNDINIFHPILLDRYFYKFFLKFTEKKNKILVDRNRNSKNFKGTENKIKDIRIENSLSSIKKTLELDDKDNIQKGCLDFATGNEMEVLLNNFQKNPKECLYKKYYNNCNIYKKKKSQHFSFRVFSPKNKIILGGNETNEININPNNNKMINNNIFINNNNYNNSTNFIINNFKDIKDINNINKINNYKVNIKKDNLRKGKLYNNFKYCKSRTQVSILSSRLIQRNKCLLPQSQSYENFIYEKKYISSSKSKSKEKNFGDKTMEEENKNKNKEEENNNKLNEDNYNNLHIKIIENEENDNDIKIIKIKNSNYIGRNNYEFNMKNMRNKFLLSRITKNIKNNRKAYLTQEHKKSIFNSTFNMNCPTYFNKEKKFIKSNMENSLTKNEYMKNINNKLLKIINKKTKKNIKRKENQLKLKKNYTSQYILNFNNIFKENLSSNFDKNIKNQIKLHKENKNFKKKIIEEKPNKTVNKLNINKINSPIINSNIITQITTPEFKSKNKTTIISYKELLSKKITNDFTKMNKSNRNLYNNLNRNNTTKMKKRTLIECKSNSNINYLSKKLFSPIKNDSLEINQYNNVTKNKNLKYNNYQTNTFANNKEKIDDFFNNLPNNYEIKENKNKKEKSSSPIKIEIDNLSPTKVNSKFDNSTQIPIKVNLNKKSFNENSKKNYYRNKNKINNVKSDLINSVQTKFLTANTLKKNLYDLAKNKKVKKA